jgi:protein ImuA
MPDTKANIIARLQKDILPLEGYKSLTSGREVDPGWGRIGDAFPNGRFPLGAVHEFLCTGSEEEASAGGFIAGLLAALMQNRGAAVWIRSSRTLFPPALKGFGIEPDRIIFVDLKKEKDVIWAMEEALKCGALAAVVGELQEIGFTTSRRLQLAVEQSGVTGFILRRSSRIPDISAFVSRWKITALPGETEEGLPGIGFPRWKVELLKVRNGRPGTWEIEWAAGRFRHVSRVTAILPGRKKKTG